ncbi:MAG TPA: peptidoglycan bridge formation glycyltransferase FemA/FemB family protein [Candidatus Moranbacteria bacterium]|nr:peptidoglycan bridge formation glycyltransferase FemA/FemB family protein [Candidatus Moranbacteria bacterium]
MENELKKQDFLQSQEWREFQEKAGNHTFLVEQDGFSASIIEHNLPIVGRYFYVPRKSAIRNGMQEIVKLAQENKAGWIRIDLKNQNDLNLIKGNTKQKILKAPHDMQPREIFVLDIAKSEEELLGEMSQKTRYNIKLAQKRGVKIIIDRKYVEDFLRLVKATAKRKGISFHAENYYRKMVETIPENMLKLYVAEYNEKIIAANLVVFYGETATYLHGATDDEYRNVMAPHLLQWQAILDAKEACLKFYDFGGVSMNNEQRTNNWQGITKFKLGFSPNTKPIEFLGSYDIVINLWKYTFYRILQKIKELAVNLKK